MQRKPIDAASRARQRQQRALAGTPITDAAAAACKIGPDERAVLAHRQHANGIGKAYEEWNGRAVLLIQIRKTQVRGASGARSHQVTPTFVLTAPPPNPFLPSGCARRMETHSVQALLDFVASLRFSSIVPTG
jgi:hypothetical protein